MPAAGNTIQCQKCFFLNISLIEIIHSVTTSDDTRSEGSDWTEDDDKRFGDGSESGCHGNTIITMLLSTSTHLQVIQCKQKS